MSVYVHQTVLLEEAVSSLTSMPGGVYVDATFGRGGHTKALLDRLDAASHVFAFDKDPAAIDAAYAMGDARLVPIHSGFRHMKAELAARGVGRANGVLFDLGISSPQIDEAARGFSFRFDAPLDMRMDNSKGETAAEWLARASEKEIGEVIWTYGEERFARAIAKAIVARRHAAQPIATTLELAQLVATEVKTREFGQDPATRTFQAIRIHINAELEELQAALGQAIDLLVVGGRLVVISFHSLEDRIVKRVLREESGRAPTQEDARSRYLPTSKEDQAARIKVLAKVRASDAERKANPRSRSAVMRVAFRLPDTAIGIYADGGRERA
jgi:16S rRNA (cytosine1402-N4)-methyltransferase